MTEIKHGTPRKRGASAEYISRTEVFEHDKWVCHLCGKKVNRKAKHPDPSSPSIDHVVPLAKGGQHVRSNVATAHLGCNMRKHANS